MSMSARRWQIEFGSRGFLHLHDPYNTLTDNNLDQNEWV
jgi:hypothetical protein